MRVISLQSWAKLPPTHGVWGKVMFSVCLFTGGGGVPVRWRGTCPMPSAGGGGYLSGAPPKTFLDFFLPRRRGGGGRGRYAPCGHAGGLSCYPAKCRNTIYFNLIRSYRYFCCSFDKTRWSCPRNSDQNCAQNSASGWEGSGVEVQGWWSRVVG